MRTTVLRWAHVLLCLALSVSSSEAATSKPNVVLVLLDNFGYGELGVYGGGVRRGAPTPRMDSLATTGLKLTNFNTEPLCTPSRAALLTGRFPIRSGTYALSTGKFGGLTRWEVTMAEMLHNVGYASALFGKWHLGNVEGRFPTDQGFDEWFGIARSNDESLWPGAAGYDPREVPPSYVLQGRRGEQSVPVGLYDLEMRSRLDGEITRRGVDFIRRQARSKQPFFAYLAMTTGHYPVTPSADWKGRTRNGPWADVLAQLDFYVGQVLDAIKEEGVLNNTIVILTADNGAEPWQTWIGGSSRGWAGPWRGSYGTAMEGGLRVPFLISWPGKIAGGRESDEMMHLVDLFPTVAKLAGGNLPVDRIIDGVDQSAFLLGAQDASNREFFPIYNSNGDLQAAKWKHWKLHFFEQLNLDDPPRPGSRFVDLLADPLEERDTGLENTWAVVAIEKRVSQFQESLKEFPPVAAGTPDPYLPKVHR